MATERYWLSNEQMTIGVKVRAGRIIETAPRVYVFKGQPIRNLLHWMRKLGPTLFSHWKLN